MGNFNRGGRSGGGNFKRRSFDRGEGGSGGRPQMHQAICSGCGQSCEVPFRPTGEKPVYCNDCFRDKKGAAPRRTERNSFSRPSSSRPTESISRDQFEVLNDKLDKILKAFDLMVSNQPTSKKETAEVEKTIKPKTTTKKAVAVKKDKAKKKK